MNTSCYFLWLYPWNIPEAHSPHMKQDAMVNSKTAVWPIIVTPYLVHSGRFTIKHNLTFFMTSCITPVTPCLSTCSNRYDSDPILFLFKQKIIDNYCTLTQEVYHYLMIYATAMLVKFGIRRLGSSTTNKLILHNLHYNIKRFMAINSQF